MMTGDHWQQNGGDLLRIFGQIGNFVSAGDQYRELVPVQVTQIIDVTLFGMFFPPKKSKISLFLGSTD